MHMFTVTLFKEKTGNVSFETALALRLQCFLWPSASFPTIICTKYNLSYTTFDEHEQIFAEVFEIHRQLMVIQETSVELKVA